jgi:hypothetical protein
MNHFAMCEHTATVRELSTKGRSRNERRSARRERRALGELPEPGKLRRGEIKDDALENSRPGCFQHGGCQEGGRNQRWHGHHLPGVLDFVKAGFHRGATVSITAILLMCRRGGVVSTGEEHKAGQFFQTAMTCDQRPEGHQRQRQQCSERLHRD